MLPTARAEALHRRLLIVQRNQFVARSFARYLRPQFDRVDVVNTPEAADAVLSDPCRTPTHLVCGLNFGATAPQGNELIQRWRKAHPTLVCAVLATGQSELPGTLEGVDAIYLKPSSPALLATMLARA